ncbi:MAG: hypothetical protein M1828_006533 [Chrysothrix sp. TS-e1954]|nr:MAG: hypothetical protein M1828_006533 [Chrysothrix sp. TS-e1954]
MSSRTHKPLHNPTDPGIKPNEVAARKGVQRGVPENEQPASRHSSQASKTTPMDNQLSFANRRRSAAHRAPLGPRPPDFSPSKRVTSDAPAVQQSISSRSFLPSAVSEPYLGISPRRNLSAFEQQSYKGNPPLTQGNGSNSPMDFDAMQDNAARQGPVLNDLSQPSLPAVESSFGMPKYAGARQNGNASSQYITGGDRQLYGPLASSRTPVRSPVRSGNPALRAAQLSTTPAADGQSSTPLVVRTKRQSQFPPSVAANLATAKQPRKSIGPGFTVPTARDKTVFDPASRSMMPSSREAASTSINRRPSNASASSKPRANAGSTPVAWTNTEGSVRATRNVKAQSVHVPTSPPSIPQQSFANSPQMESAQSVGAADKYSIAKNSFSSTPTGRRQSITSPHVGGLGARTISPTDARRSKRMSTFDGPPPLPGRSPSPELILGHKMSMSPLTPPPRMSLTPVSNRATPDPNQVAGLGRPLSSRSSYNTARPPSSSSIQSRPSFSLPSNRSSFSRPRTHSSAGVEPEFVPPVPAIPKAYESPDARDHQPFFTDVMNALGVESSHDSSKSNRSSVFQNDPRTDRPRTSGQADSARGFDFGNLQEISRVPVHGPATKNTTQQRLRLPPLNLLPLSTPTSAKIASLHTFSAEDTHQGYATTPPKSNRAKTPSTPMTASKATFPTFEPHQPYDVGGFQRLRSNTSYAKERSDVSTMDGSGSDSPAKLTADSPSNPWKTSSPFAQVAMPKLPDHASPAQNHSDAMSASAVNGKRYGSKPATPSIPSNPRASKDVFTTPSTTPNDLDPSSNSHSLRRKLSFGWRRSSSKASHTSLHNDEDESGAPQSNNMPPPKMPPTPHRRNTLKKSNPKTHPSNTSTKQSESDSSLTGSVAVSTQSSALDLPKTSTNGSYGSQSATPASRSSTSLLSRIGHRASHGNIKIQPSSPKLDQDDLAAEMEMKRLAAKKKEFEVSARELDDLRRRATVKERVSPSHASRNANLNIFERGEIIDYKDVYFCGLKTANKFVGDLSSSSTNFGFDDERGDYNIVMGDHLSYRYEVVDILGKGSFGQVVRCIDHKMGKLVAIKIIRNKKRFHQQALVEVNILQRLREWDPADAHSMINFTQSFYFRGHLCISTELLGMNLYEFIKAHDFTGFSIKLIRRFAKQMLASLCLLQTHSVIHCDLKPENILLSHPLHSEIKTIDFGSSCFETEKVYTYIQSRFYRSPEVILGMTYGMPIDMWSLGCILAELLTGYPIFPGENEQEQLACIMEVFGPPEKHLIEVSSRKKLFFDSLGKPRITVSSKGKRRRPSSKTLGQALKCDDESFIDFIARCLRWDPDRRMKPDEAMKHDFVTGVKHGPRTRSQTAAAGAASSPAKRPTASRTPSKARTLPEPPPATSYKNGVPATPRALPPSNSPVKSTPASRRKSTAYGEPSNTSMKHNSNGQMGPSALPRVVQSQRSFSGRPDLASAAAIASLVS